MGTFKCIIATFFFNVNMEKLATMQADQGRYFTQIYKVSYSQGVAQTYLNCSYFFIIGFIYNFSFLA